MATRCPNCDRGFGLRLIPSASTTWQCWCGVTVHHSVSSFLEAWIRPLLFVSIMLGAITAAILYLSGLIATSAFGDLALLALGAGIALAASLLPLLIPIALLVAYRKGIAFSETAKIKAAVLTVFALASCPCLAWVLLDVIRARFLG